MNENHNSFNDKEGVGQSPAYARATLTEPKTNKRQMPVLDLILEQTKTWTVDLQIL